MGLLRAVSTDSEGHVCGCPETNQDGVNDMKVPVSVIVPVRNEELNIEGCLRSVEWADEVFVVDSQSVDRTPEIAQGRYHPGL